MAKYYVGNICVMGSIYALYVKNDIEPLHFKGGLCSCYERPSTWKEQIYDSCNERAYTFKCAVDLCTYNSGVVSYNCMMFTYGANLYTSYRETSKFCGYYYETKTRREIWLNEYGFDYIQRYKTNDLNGADLFEINLK